MTIIRTVAPAVMPVTIEAARAALRVDGDDLDAQITIWVKGITAELEHEIGQCVMEQTWEVRLPCFPADGVIRLPRPALEVVSVKYIDVACAEQTLGNTAYRLNVERYDSTLMPARGASWPATADDPAAVVRRRHLDRAGIDPHPEARGASTLACASCTPAPRTKSSPCRRPRPVARTWTCSVRCANKHQHAARRSEEPGCSVEGDGGEVGGRRAAGGAGCRAGAIQPDTAECRDDRQQIWPAALVGLPSLLRGSQRPR